MRILIEKRLEVSLDQLVDKTKGNWSDLREFMLDRARTWLIDQGLSAKAVDSTRMLQWTSPLSIVYDIVREASAFIATPEGRQLAEANKRIGNILRKAGDDKVPAIGMSPRLLDSKPDASLFTEEAERRFWDALRDVGERSLALRESQQFAASLRLLTSLASPTAAFFDDVMVNADDPAIRDNRLGAVAACHAPHESGRRHLERDGGLSMKLVILDRDGVINHDSDHFIKSPEEWTPLPGSLAAIASLNQNGWRVAVATNQSGLARGLFDMQALNAMHAKMHKALAAVGGRIDAVFFCPHVPEDGCDCRKPKPGLFIGIARALRAADVGGADDRRLASRPRGRRGGRLRADPREDRQGRGHARARRAARRARSCSTTSRRRRRT